MLKLCYLSFKPDHLSKNLFTKGIGLLLLLFSVVLFVKVGHG
ncbi:MAG: hypothetical protein JWQ28_1221 [Pedobacter sp.]|nr:hypothetical protein [Pedobacter sp.]